MDNVEVLNLAARQFGVVSRNQVVQLGVSARTVRRARERGVIVPVLPGVFRPADHVVTFEMRAMAVLLRLGPVAYLTGMTAAALYGMRVMSRERVNVAVPTRTRADLPRWVAVTTTGHDPRDCFTRQDGLRLARPLPGLMAFAALFNDYRFDRAAEDAWHLKLITPHAAADYVDQFQRYRAAGSHPVSTLGQQDPAEESAEPEWVRARRARCHPGCRTA